MSVSAVTVVTINVLHRIHAENWADPVCEQYPVERERIDAVVRAIASVFEEDRDTIVLLQEVSHAVMRALWAWAAEREAAGARHVEVMHGEYNRKPKLRKSTLSIGCRDFLAVSLLDEREYLAILTNIDGARWRSFDEFPNAKGKGYVCATVPLPCSHGASDGGGGAATAMVVSTHISWGQQGQAQARELASVVHACTARGMPVVLGGDTNMALEQFVRPFEQQRVALSHTGSRFFSRGSERIDHILAVSGYFMSPAAATADAASSRAVDAADPSPPSSAASAPACVDGECAAPQRLSEQRHGALVVSRALLPFPPSDHDGVRASVAFACGAP